MLAKDLEMTVNWHEVTFANSTIGLRKGDYDMFGSSAVYTFRAPPYANYVGPLWSKGSLAIDPQGGRRQVQDRRRSEQPGRDLFGQCRRE